MSTDEDQFFTEGLNRRDILKAGAAGLIGAFLPSFLLSDSAQAAQTVAGSGAYAQPKPNKAYNIAFRNQHTGESFIGTYRVGNKYLPGAFDRINFVLRDFRTGDVHAIDPRTMDIMYMLHSRSGIRQPFEVLSGYRSPKTNAMLMRTGSGGVARNSLHLRGQAIDLRAPGYRTYNLRQIAMSLKAGGVGYYPKSDFVHFDTGMVRHWEYV